MGFRPIAPAPLTQMQAPVLAKGGESADPFKKVVAGPNLLLFTCISSGGRGILACFFVRSIT
jgi:hypothetical protein